MFLNKIDCSADSKNKQSIYIKKDKLEILAAYRKNLWISCSTKTSHLMMCHARCNQDCSCLIATYERSTCCLFNSNALNYLTDNSTKTDYFFVRKEYVLLFVISSYHYFKL